MLETIEKLWDLCPKTLHPVGTLDSEATLDVTPELCQKQETPEPQILLLELPFQCLSLGLLPSCLLRPSVSSSSRLTEILLAIVTWFPHCAKLPHPPAWNRNRLLPNPPHTHPTPRRRREASWGWCEELHPDP